MIGETLDIFRLRQYFNIATRARELADGVRDDVGLLDDLRPRSSSCRSSGKSNRHLHPFPAFTALRAPHLQGKRLALMATGGSGAMASLVGAARALEEAGVRPAVISLCSGSAMFGFPIAAGVPAGEVAAFTLGMHPGDYIDVGWKRLAALLPTAGRGFAGVLDGDRVEAFFRDLVGDMTLGEMPTPPTHPSGTSSRIGWSTSVHAPTRTCRWPGRSTWPSPCPYWSNRWSSTADGGATAASSTSSRCSRCSTSRSPATRRWRSTASTRRVSGARTATGWRDRRGSIFYVAGQVRTCQQVELARANLTRLEQHMPVLMTEPVPYEKVRGAGFYRQFLSVRDWPGFMRAGRTHAAASARRQSLRSLRATSAAFITIATRVERRDVVERVLAQADDVGVLAFVERTEVIGLAQQAGRVDRRGADAVGGDMPACCARTRTPAR